MSNNVLFFYAASKHILTDARSILSSSLYRAFGDIDYTEALQTSLIPKERECFFGMPVIIDGKKEFAAKESDGMSRLLHILKVPHARTPATYNGNTYRQHFILG
jgi:hypothetical protein